jgi:surface protein
MSSFIINPFVFDGGAPPVETDFVSTWETTVADETITFKVNNAIYDFNISWGDGSDDDITNWLDPALVHTYTTAGTHEIRVSGSCPKMDFAASPDNNKIKTITNMGNVSHDKGVLAGMLNNCDGLTSFAFGNSDINTGANTLNSLFKDSHNLVSIDFTGFDVGSVTTMYQTFRGTTSLTTITGHADFDTSAVTSMFHTFYGCGVLASLDVSGWDVSSVTAMDAMFYNCYLLGTIDVSSWTVTALTAIDSLFSGCRVLTTVDMSSWNTGVLISGSAIFFDCRLLTSLTIGANVDTSGVPSFANTFKQLYAITSLDLSNLDTSACTNFYQMFKASSLLDVDVSGFDITALTAASSMFTSSGFGTTNYDLLLVAWEGQIELTNVVFSAGAAKYSVGAPTTARGVLTGTSTWTITDGGQA